MFHALGAERIVYTIIPNVELYETEDLYMDGFIDSSLCASEV